ncbi:hypothetical protein Bca52824_078499 [Brassica carinata]|uniref:Uncharacterized protein n=1 Tax=Brassica carinata TaxID=52824 RepID=A0A8X7PWV2_BRACI|nr:hypothetical protein Bca52824_078499 [Brassica carinata]
MDDETPILSIELGHLQSCRRSEELESSSLLPRAPPSESLQLLRGLCKNEPTSEDKATPGGIGASTGSHRSRLRPASSR